MALAEKIRTALQRRPTRITAEEYLQKLIRKGLNPDGSQVLDPDPLAPPVGYKKTPSMVDIVRDMVRGERLRQEAIAAGAETFEEAEDFDIGDEADYMSSPWENEFDPPLVEMLEAGRQVVVEREGAERPAGEVGGDGGSPPSSGGDKPPEAS